MTKSQSSKIRVWGSITLMAGLYAGAVYWVYRKSSASSESIAGLVPLATSLAMVPLVLVIMLAILSIIAKSIRYIARVRADRISPEIREVLASVVVGSGDRERLRWLSQHHRRPFEGIFTEFLSTFGGQINSELSILAVDLGLSERWRRATRSRNSLVQKTALANLGRTGHAIDASFLRHPLEQTRIEAACALLASGSADAPALVLEMLPDQSLLGRILLAESLRPFATEICEKYLAEELRSADLRRAKASIDLLRAWERWIPIETFSRLVAERDIEFRVAALPTLRYANATEQEATQEVFDLLEFPDERVHAPAAKAASDMGISASMPLLLTQLRTEGPISALAAAQALAALGSAGRDILENEIISSPRPQYALQALEQSLVTERG